MAIGVIRRIERKGNGRNCREETTTAEFDGSESAINR